MGLLGNLFSALIDPTRENRNNLKGSFGEAQGSLAFLLFLNKDQYITLNNVTVPTNKGTTQIDHVIVSPFGIFVIESKNVKGVIYGSEEQPKWTVFLGNKKYQIQNPLRQNYAHIKALSAAIGLAEDKFHSLVFFWSDDCRFKTPMPPNVRVDGLCSYIKQKTEVLIPPAEINRLVAAINSASLPKGKVTDSAHVAQLKARYHTTHTPGDPCPRCEGLLVERQARSTGKHFLACNKYPACHYTESVS